MRRRKKVGTIILLACASTSAASLGYATTTTSIWASAPGKLLATDQTAWCSLTPATVNNVYTVTGNLQLKNSNGVVQKNVYTDTSTTITVGVQCQTSTGLSAPIFGAPKASGATVSCPAGEAGLYPRCMISSGLGEPMIYDGMSTSTRPGPGGSPCATGASGITVPFGTIGFMGQVTGQVALLNYSPPFSVPYNATLMGPSEAQVYGTDMGYMFYASGQLWAGYGDTWANQAQIPVSPTNSRGSVLFTASNANIANIANGLTYSSYVGQSTTGFATEIVPSCHSGPQCPEITAIASAGFGLQEGTTSYHVVWFTSVNNWNPPGAADSSVAWSTGGGPYVRGDQQTGSILPPVWGKGNPTTNFAAGAIWQDRMNGFIYFFGAQMYGATSGVRLARVPAIFADVINAADYQYWTGSGWSASESSAIDIIGNHAVGPEFSVAFDAYANRFLMTFVANRETPATENVQLWSASSPTGPWTQVATSNLLPNSLMLGDRYAGYYQYFYGPFMSEQLMTNGGQNIYYQLSEWNGTPGFLGILDPFLPFGLPYNVGLWNFSVQRSLASQCVP